MANNIIERDFGAELVVPAGVMKVAKWPDANTPGRGFYDLGESEAFQPTADSTTTQRNSRRNHNRELISERLASLTRTATIQVASTTDRMRQLFWGGDQADYSIAATPVTNEQHANIVQGDELYLGLGQAVPAPIFGASAITVQTYPSTLASWAATTAYSEGDYVEPAVADGFVYRVASSDHAGTSGGSEPTFPAVVGSTVTDGTVTWTCVDAKATLVEDTDYTVDDTAVTGARIGYNSSVDRNYVFVNYTPTAQSNLQRIQTGGSIVTTASLLFEPFNESDNWLHFFHKVNLTPSGTTDHINDGGSFQIWTLEAGILTAGSIPAGQLIQRPTA